MLFLTTFSFAQQVAQEFIKLVEGLVGKILRQFKQIGHQQCMTAVAWQIQEWLGLIFAAFVCQLEDSILMERDWQRRKREVPQKRQALDQALDTLRRGHARSLP